MSLNCPFCQKLMTSDRQPLLMQCGHSFCKNCIEKMPIFGTDEQLSWYSYDKPPQHSLYAFIYYERTLRLFSMFQHKEIKEADHDHEEEKENSGDNTEKPLSNLFILCLACKQPHKLLPHLKIVAKEQLEENSFLALSADQLKRKMSICMDCEEEATKKYCQTCQMYLCGHCNERIHSGSQTKKHIVVEISKEPLTLFPHHCKEHPKEECVLFCQQCQQIACVLCAYGKHKQHSICLLAEAQLEITGKMDLHLENLQQWTEKLDLNLQNTKKSLLKLQENGISGKAFIQQEMNQLRQKLEAIEQKLIQDMEQQFHQKQKVILKHLVQLKNLKIDFELRNEMGQRLLGLINGKTKEKNEEPFEKMEKMNFILNQDAVLKKCLEEIETVPLKLEPNEADIHFDFANTADEISKLTTHFLFLKFPRTEPITNFVSRKDSLKRKEFSDNDDDNDVKVETNKNDERIEKSKVIDDKAKENTRPNDSKESYLSLKYYSPELEFEKEKEKEAKIVELSDSEEEEDDDDESRNDETDDTEREFPSLQKLQKISSSQPNPATNNLKKKFVNFKAMQNLQYVQQTARKA